MNKNYLKIKICLNCSLNIIITIMYPQYREEQKVNGQIVNEQHYSEMWKLKKVY